MEKDKNKFLEILEKNRGLLFKISNTYCKDPVEQEDLIQDIIVQLWKSFDRYDPKFKISTWMYKIALNVSISYYRKSTGRKQHASSLDISLVQIAADDIQEDREEIRLLNKFIGQLDELNKALMILYLDGNSHKEIGEILNISTSNVGTKINRIKSKLKNYFQNISE